MLCRLGLEWLIEKWDAIQVELHGQYSITRFEALLQYQARNTSKLRAFVVALLTALPCLVLVVCIDALPLVSASEGLYSQTFACWFRVFLVNWLMSFTLILGFCIAIPHLPMSTLRLWTIATTIAGSMTSFTLASALVVGFPLPFAIEFQTGGFAILLASALWFSWRDVLGNDRATRDVLKRYLFVLVTHVMMLQAYIGFNLAFNQLHGYEQTLLCGLLPLMKLFFKNCVSWATFHLEDLSPTVVIFSVDMYHALFVSLTMQQASANGANIIVIVLDVVQNCIAYLEISKILKKIHHLVDEDRRTTKSSDRSRYSASDIRLKVSVIDYAGYLVGTLPRVRESREIALPRHLRRKNGLSFHSFASEKEPGEPRRTSSMRVLPILEHSAFKQSSLPPLQVQPNRRLVQRSLSKRSTRHVACTKAVLKLLHMTEFYVLVEFIEVMLTVFYAIYMMILSYLPNRVFYTQLSHLSGPQLRVTASHVAGFATAELLSLVVFCVVVDNKIKHFSTLRQLAFALETNWKLIQALILAWVFLSVQLSLEHFGSDYTFQFKWLRHSTSSDLVPVL